MPLAGLPLLLFALTLFVSATLLFLIQLMIGKMLLPMLGGTPAVWNTCMVFFQALLLAGYAYAHAATAWLGVRRQALWHLGVLLLPFLTLGLTLNRHLLDYGEGNPIPGLLLVLLLSVGLPFFVVSTSAPLLQKWFADTGHPAARDPYFLYGASNLGSMLVLFGYPTVIEPWLTLAEQRRLWQAGYGVLAVLTAVCGVCLWKSGISGQRSAVSGQGTGVRGQGPGVRSQESGVRSQEVRKQETGIKARELGDGTGSLARGAGENHSPLTPDPWPLTPGRRLRWVALAFVPSSLMLGATTYMTTDIAAIPLLWVLPLGLYLLSFILVFSRLPAAVHRTMVALLPLLVLVLLFLMLSEAPLRISWKIPVHLAVLFVAAMVCHGELARDRPATRHLTEFYLWMSVGGVLGGLFNALVAPVIFNGIVEYPLALVLACLLTPTLEGEKPPRFGPALGTGLMGFFLGIGVVLILVALGRSDLDLRGLAGRDGLWLAAALVAGMVLARMLAPAERDRSARWLDLGLPAALGVLTIGFHLGMRITVVHSGLEWLFNQLHNALPGWVPRRVAATLDSGVLMLLFLYGLPVALCYHFVKRPLRFGLGIGALLLANSFCNLLDADILLRQRSYFGALHVSDEGDYRQLYHGTTLHGMQRLRWGRPTLAAGAASPLAASDPLSAAVLLTARQEVLLHPEREPLTYFHRTGPIGQVFQAYHDHFAGRHLGLIGLGSGTLATYGQRGQKLTYYEIDPLIKRIAEDPTYFTFLSDARKRQVEVDVVLGDARLKLEERAHRLKEPARNGGPGEDKFALLVVDAFSSDAIPVHLITREALDIYRANLADDGLLVFHISNRYLDLEPVLANLAEKFEFTGFIQHDWDTGIPGKSASTWVVMAPREDTLDRLVHEERWTQWQSECGWDASRDAMWTLSALPDAGGSVRAQGTICLTLLENLRAPWRRLKVRPEVGIWNDDYSNLLRVFDWKN